MDINNNAKIKITRLLGNLFDLETTKKYDSVDFDKRDNLFKNLEGELNKILRKAGKGTINNTVFEITTSDLIDSMSSIFRKNSYDKNTAVNSVLIFWESIPKDYQLLFNLNGFYADPFKMNFGENIKLSGSKKFDPNKNLLSYALYGNPLEIKVINLIGYIGSNFSKTYSSGLKQIKCFMTICYLFNALEFKLVHNNDFNKIQCYIKGNKESVIDISDPYLTFIFNKFMLKLNNFNEINNHIRNIESVRPIEDREQFYLSLEWFFDSLVSQEVKKDFRNAFIQQSIALEALLGSINPNESPTSTYAALVSGFVGTTNSELQKIRKDFTKYYSKRSDIVHGKSNLIIDSTETHNLYQNGIDWFKEIFKKRLLRYQSYTS